MLIKLADGAGVLLVPVGRDSQATPAALRRVVRPALERFEYLLESAAAAGAVIGECVSVDSGVAELKSLEEAAGSRPERRRMAQGRWELALVSPPRQVALAE